MQTKFAGTRRTVVVARGIVRSCVLLRVEKAAYPAGEFGISFHQPPNEGTEDTPWLRLLQREI